MTPDDARTIDTLEAARAVRAHLKIIDCDIHHAMHSPKDIRPYLSQRWREHLDSYGYLRPVPFLGSSPYPKSAPALSRTDSWPPNGGPPGSDLAFMREQLLDRYNIECGLLHLLSPEGMDQRNQDFGAALTRAVNQWQYEHWTQREPRLKAAIKLPGEDTQAAVAEIEHWAGNSDFAQVSMTTHTIEPLGRRRYWPIYEAAARNNLPVALHTSGYNGHAPTGTGWPSYYAEEHHEVAISQQALVTSLICEGVFERFPNLKVVIVEAGFAWAAPLAWRLDAQWKRMRDEVPHLKHPPSHYMRTNLWFSSQQADEPERPEDLRDVLDWMGWDRLLFATDYPHWDMDDPEFAFKFRMSDAERRMIYVGNARAVYNLA
jgi:predicted TIM-barrel fold metal-dependent hydrolase